jgi:hypothetical protein
VTFRNKLISHGDELLAPRPTPRLENHPLSASATPYLIYSQVNSISRSRDGVVGITTDYGLNNRGVGVPSPGRVKNFLFCNLLFNGYGVALSPVVKWSGCEADHSPPASAEVMKMLVYTSTPQYTFMA